MITRRQLFAALGLAPVAAKALCEESSRPRAAAPAREYRCSFCRKPVSAEEGYCLGSDGGLRRIGDGLPGDKVFCRRCRRPPANFARYHPTPTQAAFHRSTARFKGIVTRIAGGKTHAIAIEALYQARENPGQAGVIVAPNYERLALSVRGKMLQILATENIDYLFRKMQNTITVFGSEISFIPSYQLDRIVPIGHTRGRGVSWFGIDDCDECQWFTWEHLRIDLREARGFASWTGGVPREVKAFYSPDFDYPDMTRLTRVSGLRVSDQYT